MVVHKITLKQLHNLTELHRLVCEQLIRKGLWQLTIGSTDMKKDNGGISRR